MRSIYPAGVPAMLRVAAVVQSLEALGLVVAAVAQVIEAGTGHSYRVSNGIAIAVLELITAALVMLIATAVARLRPWGRTPAIMTQICVALLAVILFQSHRYAWGAPALVLALAGLAALFNPASLRALSRRPTPEEAPAQQAPPPPKPAARQAPKPPAKKTAPAGSKRK